MKYEKIKHRIHEMYGDLPPLSWNNAVWDEIEREYLRCMVGVVIPIGALVEYVLGNDQLLRIKPL